MSFFQNRIWIMYGVAGWPVFMTPFATVPSVRFKTRFGCSLEAVALWEGKNLEWFFPEDQLRECAEKMLPCLYKKPWEYYENWEKSTAGFVYVYECVVKADMKTVSDEQVRAWIRELYEQFSEQYVESNIIEPLSAYFQTDLSRLLQEAGCSSADVERLVPIFGTSARPNYIKQCLEVYHRAKTSSQVEEILATFRYMNNDFCGRRSFTRADIETLAKKDHSIITGIEEIANVSEEARILLEALRVTATIQDVRKSYTLMWMEAASKLLENFAERIKVPYEELIYAGWDELIEGVPTRQELQARSLDCVIHWNETGVHVYSGIEARRMKAEAKVYLMSQHKMGEVLQGFVASPGKVTGRAVVVLDPYAIVDIKTGDILVTVMTRPEYLPLMHKAAAFVTDEGGITSHAAIVAREMKKPCIIGTKIATKLIKTGQMIEVDAEKGIVRITK